MPSLFFATSAWFSRHRICSGFFLALIMISILALAVFPELGRRGVGGVGLLWSTFGLILWFDPQRRHAWPRHHAWVYALGMDLFLLSAVFLLMDVA